MGSFSISEIITILVVILVIFGPNRLPEFARKTGRLMAQARQAVASFTAEFDDEYGDPANPIKDLSTEFGGFKDDLTRTVTNLGGALTRESPATQEGDAEDPADEVGTEQADAEATESDGATPIAAVPDVNTASDHRIEPITIEDLIADATSSPGEGDPDDTDAASGEPLGADPEADPPPADTQPGEVA
jgi:sec-independent protein translocase protein TatB